MQGYALEHLPSLFSKRYLHGDKFCFGCDMFIGMGTIRTAVEGPQGLCLISVKEHISYFSKFLRPKVVYACCSLGESRVIEDHEAAAHCQIPVQLSQVPIQTFWCLCWHPTDHFQSTIM